MADTGRIQLFKTDGAFITRLVGISQSEIQSKDAAWGQLSRSIHGICIVGCILYVAEYEHNRIELFS